MNFEKKEKVQLKWFLLLAFALPYLLGILMGIGFYKGVDVSAFPNAQMYYPAAGVMLAALLAAGAGREESRENPKLPKRFYCFFLVLTAGMALLAAASIFVTQGTLVFVLINVFHIAGSVTAWILLLMEKKDIRQANGLCWKCTKQSFLLIALFVVLYGLRIVLSLWIDGSLGEWWKGYSSPVLLISGAVVLPINFFLTFAAFFGEEYGWRYYFAPLLQKHFGLRKGVLILGILWGLWHLPINVFYYSPDTWMQSILAQQITCISIGIFFSYAYMKTGNIWVPVVLHYLNNNLAALLNGGGADALSNQVIGWGDLGWALLINGAVFLPFLFAKEYRERKNEIQE
ncbi:MAG: type II CAAX endopeptidase family protein [Lachnospiraceae bacterium]|nr:type II CAAX endopeptidase family protein [Lachnospiraceae bacterium]